MFPRVPLSRLDLISADLLASDELFDEELQNPFSAAAAMAEQEKLENLKSSNNNSNNSNASLSFSSSLSAAHQNQPFDKVLLVKESGTNRGQMNTERAQMSHAFELFGSEASKGIITPTQIVRILNQLGYKSPDIQLITQRLTQLHSQHATEQPKSTINSSSGNAMGSPSNPAVRQRKFSFSNNVFSPRGPNPRHQSSTASGPAAGNLISMTAANSHSLNPQPNINFHQFLLLIQEYRPSNNLKSRQLLRTFELLDLGNTGFISIEILRRRMKSLGFDGLNDNEMDRLIKFASSNGAISNKNPGLIDYKIFIYKLLGPITDEEDEDNNN